MRRKAMYCKILLMRSQKTRKCPARVKTETEDAETDTSDVQDDEAQVSDDTSVWQMKNQSRLMTRWMLKTEKIQMHQTRQT